MTQISNPPAFPQAGTRSKTLAIGILAALVTLAIAGFAIVAKTRAPRRAEVISAPPSYADAMRKAEAEDLAKGVTPEMAASLRAQGSVDAVEASKQRGQF